LRSEFLCADLAQFLKEVLQNTPHPDNYMKNFLFESFHIMGYDDAARYKERNEIIDPMPLLMAGIIYISYTVSPLLLFSDESGIW
jgi:hypothetical protein